MRTETRRIKRGDIYYADLNPVVGSEQGGMRPIAVLQNNVGNRHCPTVIVAAITAQTEKPVIPTHVEVSCMGSGLTAPSLVLAEQLRTIDKARLGRYLGSLDEATMNRIDEALKISVGLDPAFL